METSSRSGQLRMIVLKWDRLYGDLIQDTIWNVWPKADVKVYQRGIDALGAIGAREPDLFVTGVKVADMDGLEHLEPFIDTSLPILVVTSRPDARMFEMLRTVRYDGIFDGRFEGRKNLATALQKVLQRELYISPSLMQYLKAPKNNTLDTLTDREKIVLSVIGDGSDNLQASLRLGMSPETVGSHRKRIMGKLKVHHKGQITTYALINGYVLITADGVSYPGFQRQLSNGSSPERRRAGRPRGRDQDGYARQH